MSSVEEIRDERIKKVQSLREQGIDPFTADCNPTITLSEYNPKFATYLENQKPETVVGRIISFRSHGASIFLDIHDGTDKIQIYFKKDHTGDEVFDRFQSAVDKGDFIEVTGKAFLTKSQQNTILADGWRLLTKSLVPVPDAWYGIKDEDERFRRRYLDILLNPEVRDIVYKRSLFWNTIRTYLLEKGFIEVETPVLETTTGGADARPFVTHHNALDIDVYLRISAGELWQKKLLVAGIPRTFEIGRIFRNEGMSNEHLQDYTQLEYYMAYADYNTGMEMTKELYRLIADKVFGTRVFNVKGHTVDFDADWIVYDFSKEIQKEFGVDPLDTTIEEVQATLKDHNIEFDPKGFNLERGIDLLWKKIRKSIAGPGFLIGVPVYLEPLAKRSRTDNRVVERFQVLLAGSEMGKGFSELNDPIDQRERFMHQQALRDSGDEEAQMADMEYVEALEYGMPPAFGFGLSERLFSFLLDKPVRETQIFPLMRPRSDQSSEHTTE